MEEAKPYNNSTEAVTVPTLCPCHVPDVSKDVDFLMDHWDDPNYDLKQPRALSVPLGFIETNHKNICTSYNSLEDNTTGLYSTLREGLQSSTVTELDDESPYPEVRAAVSTVDDPLMPVNTFRMWFLGILFTIFISGTNQVFSMRFPSVLITGIVAQLISLPLGKGLERILSTTQFRTFGYTWSFNPGPFSIKEHVCITIMASVVVDGAYATDAIMTQRIFYGQTLTFVYKILITFSTQILGFSLGGILRQLVVWPSSMIWPGALVSSALFNTLHKSYGKRDRGHMTRERFFVISLVCSFIWYWVPGYFFTALSMFNWVCWIVPNNVAVNALFGTSTGLGMSILTLDWSVISFIGSPLVTPWWSELNIASSFVLFFWIVCPIIYFTNTFDTAHFPMSTYVSLDNTGSQYQPKAVATNGVFDPEKYRDYSPLFLSATLTMAYGTAFASFSALWVHAFLWFRRDIMRRLRSTLKNEKDVHSRLMQYYPEVPMWWYGLIGAVALVTLCVAIEIFPTQLPIWAALLAFILASILSIPLSMFMAITNQRFPLQVMHELIAGYMLPERPIANVLFKTIAYIGSKQAIGFAGDLKLGHYMKIPPRIMFLIQVVAAVISCFVVVLVQDWMFQNIVDICTPQQKGGFTCPSSNSLATASLIWGGIGPARLFSPGQRYGSLLWFFAIGAISPLPFYFLARRFPLSFWRYINMPVCFAGVGAIPPGSGINYASWTIVGFIFNYLIRRFHFRWWMRYNYILSAALDAGVAISMIVIFFCVQYPKGGFEIDWWGNSVWKDTADVMGVPLYTLNPGETIGPAVWL